MQLSWTQVVLVIVLLLAVLGAHVYAPASIAVITSLVSTIIGAVFINFRKSDEIGTGNAPSVSIVSSGQFPAFKDKDPNAK